MMIALIVVTDAPRPIFVSLPEVSHLEHPGPEEVRGVVQGPTELETV